MANESLNVTSGIDIEYLSSQALNKNIQIPTGAVISSGEPYFKSLSLGGMDETSGYAPCDGRSLNTYTYRDLHSVISNKYGGSSFLDGVTNIPGATSTFNVPNMHSSKTFVAGSREESYNYSSILTHTLATSLTNSPLGWALGGSRIVVVGQQFISYSTSISGTSIAFTNIPLSGKEYKSVIHDGSKFIAVGNQGTQGLVSTSSDGISWTHQLITTDDYGFKSIVFGNNKYAIRSYSFGRSERLWTSSDSITWTMVSSGNASTYAANTSFITFAKDVFIMYSPSAAAGYASKIIYFSYDLTTWTPVDLPSIFNNGKSLPFVAKVLFFNNYFHFFMGDTNQVVITKDFSKLSVVAFPVNLINPNNLNENSIKGIYKDQYVSAFLFSQVISTGRDIRNLNFTSATLAPNVSNLYSSGLDFIEYGDKMYALSQTTAMIMSMSLNVSKKNGSVTNEIGHNHSTTNNSEFYSSISGISAATANITNHTHQGSNNTDARTVYHGHQGPAYAILESGWAIEHSTLAKTDGNTSAAGNGHRHNSMGYPGVNFGDGGHYHSHAGTNSTGFSNSGGHTHDMLTQKDTWTSPVGSNMLPYNSVIFYIKV
jgi:hypothetical protein